MNDNVLDSVNGAQYNTASMMFSQEFDGGLEKFYYDNKDKHFWFQKRFISPTLRFSSVSKTVGHLWWKKSVDTIVLEDANCSEIYSNMVDSLVEFLSGKVPVGYTIDINVAVRYNRFDDTGVVLVYDYNVVSIYNGETQMSMPDIISACKEWNLNPPYYEEGEFTMEPLGKIFKTYYDFKKYVLECDSMNYELVLCRAQEEI